MLFLVHQFTREFQGRADVFDGQVVLPLHLLKAHPARQTAHNDGHWCSRAADHRFAVTDIGVYDDSIVHDTHQSTRCLLSTQAHAKPLKARYSYRRAMIGSRRAALRAGHMPKKRPTLTATTNAVTTDQRGTVPSRGAEAPKTAPLELARGRLELTLDLPTGSEPGDYDGQAHPGY